MRKFLIYLSNQHELILKGFIILIAVGSIVTILPHKVRYKFDFQKGKPWNNEDLLAPFDFAIYKDADSLKYEQNQTLQTFLPYFQKDTSVNSRAFNEFNKLLLADSLKSSELDAYILAGKSVISDIYSTGLIRLPEGFNKQEVMLVFGKTVKKKRVADFLNEKTAADYIKSKASSFPAVKPENLQAYLSNSIISDVFFDQELTSRLKDEAINEISLTRGIVKKGDLVISRGEVVNQEKYLVLKSLKEATENSQPDMQTTREIYLGQLLIVCIAFTVLLIFLGVLRKDIFADNRRMTLIFLLMVLIIGAYTGVMKVPSLSLYVVPMCVLPIVIRVFFDTRLALFTHVITVLILGSVAPNGYEFVYMQIIAGMVTIFSVTHLRKRAQLFISAGMIFISYVVCYSSLSIIHEGSINGVNWINLAWLVANVLMTLFAYPLIYIFEKMFSLISDVSLMELSDTNAPLLRELSMKAPGTFQHSMQVANLAEAAIFRIGGNSLLVRVGALYHDIGKMEMPMYFIENQSTGVNPHDELSFEESASIIISHVINGIEKARKNKLPDLIIDFIRTHHGTTMVQYFYQSFLKNYPEKIVDEEDFRYPGPLPFSKETAVLMMADSVEASSRSLSHPDFDKINKLVDSIIDRQIEQQQFINCDITFKDISTIKKIFKKMLMSIYHVRVEYPRA